jgi:ubiquinol-cytochrome c reductase cytochrome b subunit
MISVPDWMRHAGQWFDDRLPTAFIGEALREPIPGGARFSYVLGSATLYLCLLQVVTGIWQMFYYAPTVDHAYASVTYIRLHVPFGWLMHGLHYWGAQAFIVVMGLHVIRVFVWGAYKAPRELIWIIGVLLLVVGAGLIFTGALLPWDMLGYWAAQVGTSMAGTIPWVGDFTGALLRGGATMGQLTLTRFFTLHVMILPAVLALLIAAHLVAFRKQGSAGPWNPAQRATTGPFWPDQVFKDLLFIAGMTVILVGLSAFLPAPFSGEADPLNSTHVPKPEWNFLFLYEAVKAFKGAWEPVGTVGVPTILLLLLLSLPFIDRRSERTPWKRPVAMIGGFLYFSGFIVLTVLGGGGPDNIPPGTVAGAAAEAGGASETETATNAQIALGKKLFASAGCIACHAINGEGGAIGPDLSNESQKGRTAAWLATQLVTPKQHLATSMMPPTTLAVPERDALIAYLLSMTSTAAATAPRAPALPAAGAQGPPGPASLMIGDAANGRVLFDADCASCHGQAVHGAGAAPAAAGGAVNLGQLGPGFFDADAQRFADNIDRYIQHGSRGTAALSMPAFGDSASLTQPEIANIEAYILAVHGVDRAAIVNPGVPPATFFIITLVVLGGTIIFAFTGTAVGKG